MRKMTVGEAAETRKSSSRSSGGCKQRCCSCSGRVKDLRRQLLLENATASSSLSSSPLPPPSLFMSKATVAGHEIHSTLGAGGLEYVMKK
jgi:hypothetical protein